MADPASLIPTHVPIRWAPSHGGGGAWDAIVVPKLRFTDVLGPRIEGATGEYVGHWMIELSDGWCADCAGALVGTVGGSIADSAGRPAPDGRYYLDGHLTDHVRLILDYLSRGGALELVPRMGPTDRGGSRRSLLGIERFVLGRADGFVEHQVDDDACACCGVTLEPKPTLCEDCAPTFTTYADGTSCCERHAGDGVAP